MVNEVEFTDFARNKLKLIYKYYSENVSENVAKKLIDNIIKSTDKLLNFPESGQLELFKFKTVKEFRSVKYKNYKLFYSYQLNKIVVFNIFDMRQNPKILEREMKNLK